MGKAIKVFPDGIWLFDNFLADTVVIHTLAGLGESWIFYSDSSAVWYEATVSSVGATTILGSQDSVKTITLSAQSSTGAQLGDSLHNRQLMLSKAHGLILTPDLHMFPYHRPGQPYDWLEDYFLQISSNGAPSNWFFTALPIPIPKWTEVYDYDLGDVTETFYNAKIILTYTQTHIHDSVVGKSVKPNETSYQLLITNFGFSGNNPVYLKSVSYINAANAPVVYLPERYPDNLSYYLIANDSSWCRTSPLFRQTNHGLFDTTVYPGLFYPNPRAYKVGVGQLYNLQGDGEGGYRDYRLSFARLNGVSCGTYVAVGVNEGPRFSSAFSVYPNPASEHLTLQSDHPLEASIQLMDLSGKAMIKANLTGSRVSIPVKHLNTGVYLLKVSDRAGQSWFTNITVRH